MPATGEVKDYDVGTPERKLAEYLSYWKAKNYGHAAMCLHPTLSGDARKKPGLLQEIIGTKLLASYTFLTIEDSAAAVTTIETELKFEENGKDMTEVKSMRLIYTSAEGEPATRGEPDAEWCVMSWQGC